MAASPPNPAGIAITLSPNYHGPVTLTYQVDDGNGGSTSATQSFAVASVADAPVITGGPATGDATEAPSLDGIRGADQTPNFRLEPVVNYDAALVSLLAAHPNDMHAVLLGLQAQLPSGSGFAEAMAIVWDYVDDNFSYYNTVINEISARLSVEYALYLTNGGAALTGTAAKYTPDGADPGTAPDRYQSLHDNILGNLNGAGLVDKFLDSSGGGSNGPPNGTADQAAYDRIIQLLADNMLSDLFNRPVYSGTEGAANLALAYDQANGLLPATGGTLTATDGDGDMLSWSGSATGIYGTFTIASNGAWTYLLDQFDPDTQALGAGESALDTFTATVDDGNGGTASQQVTITVHGSNDAPVGVADALLAGGTEDVVYHVTTAQLLSGFTDLDNDSLSVVGLIANHGSVAAEPGGFAITLAPNYHGPVTLTYQVDDGNGGSTSATQSFNVNGAPDVTGPVTGNATEGGGVYTFDPLANASDPDAGDGLVVIPAAVLPAGVSFAGGSAATIDFSGYALGSVVGQFGWTDASPSSPDNAIVDVSGNRMLRLANDPSSGDFGGPFSPAFSLSAGEGGAAADTLSFSFTIRAVNNVADGSRLEIDLGTAARDDRYNFMAIEYTAGGLRLVQNTPLADIDGNWQSNNFDWGAGNIQLGALLDASAAHTIQVVFRAVDGSNNDIVEYYVDGTLVGTGSTFENFREFHLAQSHASAVSSVNNVLFRTGEPAGVPFPADGPGGQRQGFYLDDLALSAYDSHLLQFNADDPAYDHLVAGATQLVTVNYTVADGHGGLTPTSTVITVTGTNDAASIGGTDTGTAVEAGVDAANAPFAGTPAATGTLVVSDVDDGENELVPIPAGTAGTGGYGTFEVLASGAWTYSLNNADPDTHALYVGQVVSDTITVQSEDGTASHVITVTITGTNDAPVVTGPVTGNATEGGGVYTFDPLANASDPDAGDGLVVIPAAVLPAGVSFAGGSAATIDFSGYALGSVVGQFGWTDASPSSPDNAIVDVSGNRMLRLANDPSSGDFGGPFSPAFSLSAGEGGAAADTLSFSFTIRAVNNVADGSRLEIDLGTAARDDRYNFMAIEYTAGGLRLVQNTPLADIDGNWQSNNFDWGAGNIQLGALLDASAAHTIQVVFRAVDGSNNDIVEYYVDGTLVGTGSTFENFREFHLAQSHASAVSSVNNVLFRTGEPAGVPFPADGPGGQRQGFYLDDLALSAYDSHLLQFNADDPAYDHLVAGATQLVTVNYTVADGHGGLTPTSTVITVTGTNDGPTAVDDTNSATEDGPLVIGSVATNDSDPDDGETATLQYTLNGAIAGLTLNLNGSYSFNPADAAYQYLAAGQTAQVVAAYTVTDAQNATDAGTLTITVTGTNDAPVNTVGGAVSVNEDNAVALTGVFIGDVDGSPGDTYTVLLSVQHGTLAILTNVPGGITGANIVGGGNGTNGLTITGTLAQINATLAAAGGLTYQGDLNFNGSDGLRVSSWEGVPADAASFAAPLNSAALTNATSLVTGDLNGDGRLDLVYIGGASNQIGVRFGNGDGTFGATTALAAGTTPSEVILADIDGDGDLDLVSTDYATGASSFGSVGVLLNNGSGTFGTYQSLAALQSPYDVVAGDVNGDGRLDLIVDRRDYGLVSVLLASGAPGSFAAAVNYNASIPNITTGITLGDFNNDGRLDIIAFNPGNKATGNVPGTVSLLLNNGNGTFAAPADIFSSGTVQPYEGLAYDLNNDGNLDLVFANYTVNDGVTVMLGNGNGTFGASAFYATISDADEVRVGDVNGDGIADIVTSNGAAGSVALFLGNGNGTFQSRVDLAIGSSYAETPTLGDFNGDGRLDIVVNGATNTGQRVLLNSGTSLGDTDVKPITVTSVNDAPAGTDGSATFNEDTSYAFSPADFGFTDAADGNAFLSVFIITLPGNGTLTVAGNPVTAGQEIVIGLITALVFTPAPNANGNNYASFTFQVRDTGGTANGGVDTDQSANTFTLNVAPVNDPPAIDLNGAAGGTTSLATFTENGAAAVLAPAATLVDIDSPDFDTGTLTVSILTGASVDDALSVMSSGQCPRPDRRERRDDQLWRHRHRQLHRRRGRDGPGRYLQCQRRSGGRAGPHARDRLRGE